MNYRMYKLQYAEFVASRALPLKIFFIITNFDSNCFCLYIFLFDHLQDYYIQCESLYKQFCLDIFNAFHQAENTD